MPMENKTPGLRPLQAAWPKEYFFDFAALNGYGNRRPIATFREVRPDSSFELKRLTMRPS